MDEEKVSMETMLGSVELIKSACQMAMLVPLEVAVAALHQADKEEAIAPLLDPTHYMRHRDGMHNNVELLRVFVKFRSALGKLAGEED